MRINHSPSNLSCCVFWRQVGHSPLGSSVYFLFVPRPQFTTDRYIEAVHFWALSGVTLRGDNWEDSNRHGNLDKYEATRPPLGYSCLLAFYSLSRLMLKWKYLILLASTNIFLQIRLNRLNMYLIPNLFISRDPEWFTSTWLCKIKATDSGNWRLKVSKFFKSNAVRSYRW